MLIRDKPANWTKLYCRMPREIWFTEKRTRNTAWKKSVLLCESDELASKADIQTKTVPTKCGASLKRPWKRFGTKQNMGVAWCRGGALLVNLFSGRWIKAYEALLLFSRAVISDGSISDLISHWLESRHLHKLESRNANIPNSGFARNLALLLCECVVSVRAKMTTHRWVSKRQV